MGAREDAGTKSILCWEAQLALDQRALPGDGESS